MKRVFYLLLLLPIPVIWAESIAPVVWYDAASNGYSVACYWREQFPKIDTACKGRHVLFVSPYSAWTNRTKQAAVTNAVGAWLSGKTQVTSNSLAEVSTAAGDAAVKMIATDDPLVTLKKLGLAPPKSAIDDGKTNAVIAPK